MRKARVTSKTKTLRNKGPFPPLLPVSSQGIGLESAKRSAISHCDSCDDKNAAIRVPKERYGDGQYRSKTFAMQNR